MNPLTGSLQKPGRSTSKRKLALFSLLTLTASVYADIRISDLTDINFGTVPPTAGQLINTMDFCVSMDRPGRYSVIARGSGPADSFTLSNGSWDLPYTLQYSDKPGQPGTLMTPGFPESGFRGSNRKKRVDCNRPSASITVTIEAADLQAASPGQYSGQLTLMVTPE